MVSEEIEIKKTTTERLVISFPAFKHQGYLTVMIDKLGEDSFKTVTIYDPPHAYSISTINGISKTGLGINQYFDGSWEDTTEENFFHAFANVQERQQILIDGITTKPEYKDEKGYAKRLVSGAMYDALMIIPAERLRSLAVLVDKFDLKNDLAGTEVQDDLRKMADMSEAAIKKINEN